MIKSKMNEYIERGNYKQYTERDIDGAYEEYSKLVKNYPNHVEGFLLRGHIKAHYRYEYVDAKNDFKKAVEIDPNHSDACYEYGSLLCRLGEINEGVKYLEHSVEVKPNGCIYDEIGENKLLLKEYEEALEAFINAAEIQLKDEYCWYENVIQSFDKAVKLFLQKKEYQDAIKYLNKIIEIRNIAEREDYEPNDFDEDECKDFYDPYVEIKLIAFCLYLVGDFEASINKLNEVIEKFSNTKKENYHFKSSLILRGQAFIKCNKIKDAYSDWDKVSFSKVFGNQIAYLETFEQDVFDNYAVRIEFKECREYFS